jgi:hypothetical protein
MDDNTLYDLFGSLSREIGAVRGGVQRIEARLDLVDRIFNVRRLEEWAWRSREVKRKRNPTPVAIHLLS